MKSIEKLKPHSHKYTHFEFFVLLRLLYRALQIECKINHFISKDSVEGVYKQRILNEIGNRSKNVG